MVGFFKKDGDVPPDVGDEEKFEAKKKGNKSKKDPSEDAFDDESSNDPLKDKLPAKKKSVVKKNGVSSDASNLELERLKVKLDTMDELIRSYSEKFSYISQQIGELRSVGLTNEKSISKATVEASKVVDIVKEVKPDKLRIDFQKVDMKVQALNEKLESNKQLYDTIMNEVKDLRRKAGIFVGTDALLKLNDEVKKDLIEIKKTASRVKLNADKSEQIFVEVKKGFAESQKNSEMVSNLDQSYSGLNEQLEKLKIDHSQVVSQDDFGDFQKTVNNKFAMFTQGLEKISYLEKEMERLSTIVETTLSIAKTNKNDVADVALTIGDDKVKRVSDYENQLASILKIIDTLAGQISQVKKKVGISSEKKISVDKVNKKIIGKDDLKMKNLDLHPEVSAPLVKKEEVKKKDDKNSDDKKGKKKKK